MKKAGIFILALFYFMVASGFAINAHYCSGKLKNLSLSHKNEDCCCGSKKKARGCCKEKMIMCKITDNQTTTAKAVVPDVSTKQVSVLYVLIPFLTYQPLASFYLVPEDSPPPCLYSDPVFLLNRNFRI